MKRLAPALLALVLLALPAPLAAAQSGQGDASRGISVTGTARVEVQPDTARFGFSITANGATREAALRRVSVKTRRVLAAVEATGIPAADTRTGQVEVFQVTKRRARGEQPAVVAQRAATSVSVQTGNVEATGRAIPAAIAAGATSVNGPRFSVSDTAPAFEDALAAAFDQARRKAQRLADRAGVTLGRPVRIREQGADDFENPPPPRAAPDNGGGGAPAQPEVPVRPGPTTIRATVSVIFAIE